jgi:phage-related protein
MSTFYHLLFFEDVRRFIIALPYSDQAKIKADTDALGNGNFVSVSTKTLRGPIRELIVKDVRLLFCIEGNSICFLHAFIKKSMKTPAREIDHAEKMYKAFHIYFSQKT